MDRRLLACLAALALLPPAARGADPDLDLVRRLERQRIDLARRLAPAVCAVFRGQGGGSGVVITEDGLVLSNFHVTELDSEMRIGLDDNRIHPAVVLGVDPSGDLALLRLTEPRAWTHSPLGDSDALRQGDWVYAMGNPFLLATDFTPTITLGVVSGKNRYQPGSIRGQLLYPDCIQTDASINPGNSGGPLFNFAGEVVGINGRVSLRDRGRVNIGVGYAISSNQIKHCLPELRAGKIVEHGTLNATVRDIEDPDWPGGVRVTFDRLLDPGCAYAAGIRLGDALLAFQGRPVPETNEFSRLVAVLPKGRRVSLRVATHGEKGWEERDVRVTLDGVPLILPSQQAQRRVPETYVAMEIDRTLAAARAALAPIGDQVRRGTLAVEGREPRPLEERYAGGAPVPPDDASEEKRQDLAERAAAWNDLLAPEGRRRFASVEFTGGALVGDATADRFEVETKAGQKRVYFVELASGRLLRCDLYAQAWARWISVEFDAWRDQWPMRVRISDREKEKLLQTIDYESVGAP